jgi:type IX secretion system substrate protein
MKKYLSFLFIVFSFSASGQVPEPAMLSLRGVGGSGYDEVGTLAIKTADGGFIIGIGTNSAPGTGNISSYCTLDGERDIFMKYNADGSILEWTKCLQIDGDTSLGYIFPTADGGFVFGGNYNTTGWGIYICKQDALGNIVWSHGYSRGSNLYLSSMMATDDGGYIIAGESSYVDTNSTIHYGSFTEADIFVMKVDGAGNKVWGKVIGGTGDDNVYSVIAAPNAGCYIVGGTTSNDYDCTGNHGIADVYLARLDSDGNLLWHRDLGGKGADNGHYGYTDGKGGVIIAAVTGSADGDVTYHIGTGAGENIWVLNVDSSNNILWNNCYGGGGDCYPNSICKAADGSIWVAGVSSLKYGEMDTAYGGYDAWFVHADSGGNFINAKVIGSHLDDRGMMIYPLSNGNVIAGGFYDTLGIAAPDTYYGSDDAFLAVFAPWNQTGVKVLLPINNEVRIYPNPTIEEVTIEVEQRGNYTVAIANLIGKTIYQSNLNGTIQIRVRGWPRGMYFVLVSSEDGFKTTKKLMVE